MDPVSLLDLGLAELAMGKTAAANSSLSAALQVSEAQGQPLAEAVLGVEQTRLRLAAPAYRAHSGEAYLCACVESASAFTSSLAGNLLLSCKECFVARASKTKSHSAFDPKP